MANEVSNNNGGKPQGVLSAGRLAIGVISIVLFAFISFQSCAAGFVNTIEDNNDSGGTAGIIMAICMLVSGIVGIATRNSKGKSGAIITAAFYLFGAILAWPNAAVYKDLSIWAGLAAIFAIFYIICAVKTKKSSDE